MNWDLKYLYLAFVVTLLIVMSFVTYSEIGGALTVIVVGIAGGGGLIAWVLTTFNHPAEPKRVVPLYYLTLALLMAHIVEEYLTDFPIVFSKTFSVNLSMGTFILYFPMVNFVFWISGGVLLYYKNPLGNYLCWFMFIAMIFAELSHYAFPLFDSGQFVYYPGMYTALLPLIPAIIGMYRLIKDYQLFRTGKIINA